MSFNFDKFIKTSDLVTESNSLWFYNIKSTTIDPLSGQEQVNQKRVDSLNDLVCKAIRADELVVFVSLSTSITDEQFLGFETEIKSNGFTLTSVGSSKSGKTYGFIVNPEESI